MQAGLLFRLCAQLYRVCRPGVVMVEGRELAPVKAHVPPLAEELLEGAEGWILGERNDQSTHLTESLGKEGITLRTPGKSKKEKEFSGRVGRRKRGAGSRG